LLSLPELVNLAVDCHRAGSKSPQLTMDVTHPDSKPLSDDQKALLEEFRNKVESRISSHGLTAADVQSFVDEIKKHPEVSAALLEEIRSEVGKLMQGQRFSFDFD
jgi:hypothetical protein